MPASPLGNLPHEVLTEIFQYCDKSTLLQLCTTSSWLHNLAIPQLYRSVDLSTHKRGLVKHCGELRRELLSNAFPQPFPDPVKNTIAEKQRCFLHTLKRRHPEYAPFVREFTWTLLFGTISEDSFGADCEKLELEDERDGYTWEVFQKFENVKVLDLASLHYRMQKPYTRNCPEKLFSDKLRSVRLTGWMNRRLPEAILHSINPARLEHLALDDVQHWGEKSNGEPLSQEDLYGGARSCMRIHPRCTIPSTMPNLLTPLIGRCPNLRSLHLSKTGQELNGDLIHHGPTDIAVYQEWAAFIESVKGSLQYLKFEQGAMLALSRNWRRRYSPPRRIRPMDERFKEFLLPVLMGGGWRELEEIYIAGVANWLTGLDMERFRKANGTGDVVKMVCEAGRASMLWSGY